MELKNLKIKDFMSIASADINLASCGVVLVHGRNLDTNGSNGAGKTSLFDALFFALTSDTDKSVKNIELIRIGQESAEIELHVDDYVIKRQIHDSVQRATLVGPDIEIHGVSNVNNFLKKILPPRPEWVIRFAQHDRVEFGSLTRSQQRHVIEHAFNMFIIDRIIKELKQKKSALEMSINRVENIIKHLQDVQADEIKKLEEDAKRKIDTGALQQYQSLNVQLQAVESQLARYHRLGDKCPTCGQQISQELRNSIIGQLMTTRNKLLSRLESIKDEADRINQLLQRQYYAKTRLSELSNIEKFDVENDKLDLRAHEYLLNILTNGTRERLMENYLNQLSHTITSLLEIIFGHSVTAQFVDGELVIENRRYRQLSGGERRCVDIVISLAIREILMSGKSCNVFIIDEAFDALDDRNMSLLIEKLPDICKADSIFLITHRPVTIPYEHKRLIVEKFNNVTNVWME